MQRGSIERDTAHSARHTGHWVVQVSVLSPAKRHLLIVNRTEQNRTERNGTVTNGTHIIHISYAVLYAIIPPINERTRSKITFRHVSRTSLTPSGVLMGILLDWWAQLAICLATSNVHGASRGKIALGGFVCRNHQCTGRRHFGYPRTQTGKEASPSMLLNNEL